MDSSPMMSFGAIPASRARDYGKNSHRYPRVRTLFVSYRLMLTLKANPGCSGICTSKSSVRMSIPRAKASGFIPIFQSTPTGKRASLPIGTMNQECRGRLKRTTTARERRFAPGHICGFMKTVGQRPRKYSSPLKCGIRALIHCIIDRLRAATALCRYRRWH
jgi:hypothetical protein